MLDVESKATEGLEDEDGEDIDLISQLADMSIRPDNKADKSDTALDMANPVFEEKKPSSKIAMVIHELEKLKKKSQVLENAFKLTLKNLLKLNILLPVACRKMFLFLH